MDQFNCDWFVLVQLFSKFGYLNCKPIKPITMLIVTITAAIFLLAFLLRIVPSWSSK